MELPKDITRYLEANIMNGDRVGGILGQYNTERAAMLASIAFGAASTKNHHYLLGKMNYTY